jgi:hypothetical protein
MPALDPIALKQQAATAFGQEAFGDDPFAENFEHFLQSLNTEGVLTPEGQAITGAEILALLRNRLEIAACLAANPAIRAEPISSPIFLMGLPRSGTTFLQNLFNHDPQLRTPSTWETLTPCPPPGAEPASVPPRIAAASRHLNQWRENVENFDATHLIDVTGPDECALLLSIAFAQVGFQNYLRVPGFFDWLLDEGDLAPAYAFHKTILQILQYRTSPRRWVLKYPNHMLAMTQIRALHPDAVFVVTHRDPVQTLASICALTESYRGGRYPTQDRAGIGAEMLHFVQRHIARMLDARATPGFCSGIIDIDYYRLIADPQATVAGIYARVGLEMPASVRTELANWIAANPKGKRGKHDYRLTDYGLDFFSVNAGFAPYRSRFAIPMEHEALEATP